MRRLPLLGLLLALVLALAPAAAHAGNIVGLPVTPPTSMNEVPPGFRTSTRQALEIARRQPAFARQFARPHRTLDIQIYAGIYWQVGIIDSEHGNMAAVVNVSPYGNVIGTWTGVAAGSYIARDHFEMSFRRPWVWLTFGILFLLPFIDVRRLRRLLVLDLAVVLSFGASFAVLDAGGHSDLGVLLIYPPMLYLLGRMLLGGLRPRGTARGRLVPHFPTWLLVVGLVALVGGRVALNVENHKVMDIGFASVAGADRIMHRQPLYVDNDTHGDTYGPVNYLSYIPFEAAFPFKGVYDRLWAAHAGAIFFDLMTIVGLVLLGLKLRAGPEGRRLGLAMAWAFAACPFTLLTMMDSTNDGLVAMLLVIMLLVFQWAPARGLALGLATAAKFSPAALLLVVARGTGGRDGDRADGRRQWLQVVGVCAAIFVFTMAVYFPADGGFRALWNCTLGYQLGRDPDFSLWAVFFNLGWLQKVLDVFGIGVALVAGLWPGRRTLTQVCALAAAVLIAIQLPGGHWFYYYITWWAPLVIAALFTRYKEPLAAALPQDSGSEEDGEASSLAGAGASSRSAFLAA
jgi:hypothetical protein